MTRTLAWDAHRNSREVLLRKINRNRLRRCDNHLRLVSHAQNQHLISMKLNRLIVLSTSRWQSDGCICTAELSDDRGGKPVCKNQIWRKRLSECTPAARLSRTRARTHTHTSKTLQGVTWSLWWHHLLWRQKLRQQKSERRVCWATVTTHTLSPGHVPKEWPGLHKPNPTSNLTGHHQHSAVTFASKPLDES